MGSARRLTAIAVSLLALLAAVLVWGVGLDRLSRRAPRLATAVPETLRHYAWRLESVRALQARQPAKAVSLAERGVLIDPIDPAAISTLAIARLVAGDASGAAAAMRVAGRMGWRDQPTQIYWLTSALQGGTYAIAAERLDAILRQNPDTPQRTAMLAAFERSPEGRHALAKVLAVRPPWLPAYLTPDDQIGADQLAARALVLMDPALTPARLACDDVAKVTNALSARRRTAEAGSLWRSRCGDRRGVITDGGFERSQLNDASPFDWQFPGEGGLTVGFDEVDGSRAATVESAMASTRIFAFQALQLSPRSYRIAWRAVDGAGNPTDRIRLRLTCRREVGPYLEAKPEGDGRFSAFAVPTAGCPTPWLELAVRPGIGKVAIDDIKVEPA